MLGGKQQQFLATKVVPPRCPGLIERPRLVDATSQLSEKRLAVVKGPAGFGKTSLAVAWLQRLPQGGNPVAWLTIDTDDDEPATFLFYLDRYSGRSGDFFLVLQCCHAALRPTASTSASRSSMTRW